MDNLGKLGLVFFGVSMAIFGVQYFLIGGYAGGLPPVPPWAPGGMVGAYVIGAILIVTGLAIAAGYWASVSAAVLGIVFLFCLVTLHAQRLSAIIHDGTDRTRAFEVLALGGIAFVIAGVLAGAKPALGSVGGWKMLGEIGRWLFAIAMIIFGAQHFMYAAYVATLIPGWIPGHLFFTYLTGAGMIAAGVSFAIKIYSRAAGILLGSMFLFWVLLLHTPRVLAQMHNKDELTSAFVALAMCGGAFTVAGTLRRNKGIAGDTAA